MASVDEKKLHSRWRNPGAMGGRKSRPCFGHVHCVGVVPRSRGLYPTWSHGFPPYNVLRLTRCRSPSGGFISETHWEAGWGFSWSSLDLLVRHRLWSALRYVLLFQGLRALSLTHACLFCIL